MPNLKDIRTRIKSVKNTQKITQAMRMVAAAKVKRAENSLKESRPYTELLTQVMARVMPELHAYTDTLKESVYAPVMFPATSRRVGLFVVAADRGLCGTYNTNLLKQLEKELERYKQERVLVRVYLVGNKSILYTQKHHPELDVLGKVSGLGVPVQVLHARKASDVLLEAFTSGIINGVDVLYTKFNNMVSYEVTHDRVFPLNRELFEHDEDETVSPEQEALFNSAALEFEPDPASLMEEMIPMYLKRRVYGAMLEASASELAARMTAMQSATDNAKGLIHRLTLAYNKARQAAITQEIMEIVGGAEALR